MIESKNVIIRCVILAEPESFLDKRSLLVNEIFDQYFVIKNYFNILIIII